VQALPADKKFQEIASRFVLVRFDTENGREQGSTRLGVNRNRTYFLVLDAEGNEIERMFGPDPRKRQSPQLLAMMRRALRTKKGSPLVERLVKLLRSPQVDTRVDAIEAIGHLGKAGEPAVHALLPMLRDRSGLPSVSWWTIRALSRIGPAANAAVPGLLELVRDVDHSDSERQLALMALGEIDPAGEKIVPGLRDALAGNGYLVIGASIAAQKIGSAAAPLAPALERAAKRFPAGPNASYIRKALDSIREQRASGSADTDGSEERDSTSDRRRPR